MSRRCFRHVAIAAAVLVIGGLTTAAAQTSPAASASAANAPVELPEGVPLPADYIIGPEDVLHIILWRDKDMSSEVTVRPDGRITLPLVNEIVAAGLTPETLRVKVTEAADRFVDNPTVSVIVKQINSRKVFITGQIAKPGPYPLGGPLTVMQLIAMAGGVHEFADQDHITILRYEGGKAISIPFNYEQVKKRKNLQQNILLKPGDTIIVP